MAFTYFVILAEMRTGSNFLEESINSLDDVTCHGEAFNPNFVGYPNKDGLFGIDLAAREEDPIALIEHIKAHSPGIGGFRLFSDHDHRVLAHVLADPECAKVVLTRNPIDSYVSLKIAAKTGQWRLNDATKRREVQVTFDPIEFRTQLAAKQAFQGEIAKGLQHSGQTAFHMTYEDVADLNAVNGLVQYIGSDGQLDSLARKTKKQNPAGLEEKVANYQYMVESLASIDRFGMSQVPNFEPQRGPGVPGFYFGKAAPLLFIPIEGGPKKQALTWLSGVDRVEPDDLLTEFSQKQLRQWKKAHPGHRSFAILRHPLARAHHVFCSLILPKEDERFKEPRRIMRNKYGVSVPNGGNLEGYTVSDHRVAFGAFLKFLKANLSDQTSIRVDPNWATQAAVLEGAAAAAMPDIIIRESEAAPKLGALAAELGLVAPDWTLAPDDQPFALAKIYDAELEKLCLQAYRKDYINFGFADWA